MEYNARSVAEAILIVSLCDWVSEAGQHVIDFDWPNGKALGNFNVKSTTGEHGKRVLSSSDIRATRNAFELRANPFNLVSVSVAVGAAEQDFPKRSYFPHGIPKHRPELVSEHVALGRDWGGKHDGGWRKVGEVVRSGRNGEIGASVAHELTFNAQILVEEKRNAA